MDFKLFQNYPNPFNPETTIQIYLPSTTTIVLDIFNASGKRVRRLLDTKLESGFHQLSWEGKNNSGNVVASGIYFIVLKTNEIALSKKMSLIR